jgi:hypothetical protein
VATGIFLWKGYLASSSRRERPKSAATARAQLTVQPQILVGGAGLAAELRF